MNDCTTARLVPPFQDFQQNLPFQFQSKQKHFPTYERDIYGPSPTIWILVCIKLKFMAPSSCDGKPGKVTDVCILHNWMHSSVQCIHWAEKTFVLMSTIHCTCCHYVHLNSLQTTRRRSTYENIVYAALATLHYSTALIRLAHCFTHSNNLHCTHWDPFQCTHCECSAPEFCSGTSAPVQWQQCRPGSF